MKCKLVWRNGYPELRVISSNNREQEYLAMKIGKVIEVEIINCESANGLTPQPPDRQIMVKFQQGEQNHEC